jgi:hypothetical protein
MLQKKLEYTLDSAVNASPQELPAFGTTTPEPHVDGLKGIVIKDSKGFVYSFSDSDDGSPN